jgi:hypothetical protein
VALRAPALRSGLRASGPRKAVYPARELLNLIRQLAAPVPDSALGRKLRGPMAAWDMNALLLRQIDLRLAGANWQRSGGKGQKPKPIPLPDTKGRGDQPAPYRRASVDVVDRLRALGMVPGGTIED